jgi:hypothetical protein
MPQVEAHVPVSLTQDHGPEADKVLLTLTGEVHFWVRLS